MKQFQNKSKIPSQITLFLQRLINLEYQHNLQGSHPSKNFYNTKK